MLRSTKNKWFASHAVDEIGASENTLTSNNHFWGKALDYIWGLFYQQIGKLPPSLGHG